MTSPLVHRELLVQGRYWGNYWLRVVVAGAGLFGLCVLWVMERTGDASALPSRFFAGVILGMTHAGITAMLGLGGAVLTADCLAKERREGTLGLLFLTPLTAREITLGKCVGQALRLGSLWLAAVPFLAIPFLLGGVTPRNFLDALLVHITAGCTGLSAGLLATARCQQWRWAMISAGIWLLSLYVALVIISSLVVYGYLILSNSGGWDWGTAPAIPIIPLLIFAGLPLEGPISASGGGIPTPVIEAARLAILALTLWSVFLLLLAVTWVFRTLSRVRDQRSTPAVRTQGMTGMTQGAERSAVAPVESPIQRRATGRRRDWISRSPRWLLDMNPVHWLESSGTLPRLAPWALVALVLMAWIGIGLLCLSSGEWVYVGWGIPTLLTLLAVGMAAASFRQEHEEGGMELILCTPLRPWWLITGRLRAVAGFVFPALAVSVVGCLVFRGPSYAQAVSGGTTALIPAHVYLGPAWGFWGVATLLYGICAWTGQRIAVGWRLYWGGWVTMIILVLAGIEISLLGRDYYLIWFQAGKYSTPSPEWADAVGYMALLAINFTSGITAVCLALRSAVRRVHPLMGCMIGVGVGVALPYLVGALATILASSGMIWPYPWWYEWLFVLIALPVQVALALTSVGIAHRDLRTRQFQFRPFQRRAA